jgi:hypothetical protein
LLIKFFGALADCGYLNITTFENTLKQLLDLHTKAISISSDNDYFLNLALVGYFFGRRRVRENVQEGSRPEIESILETHIQNRPNTTDDYNVFKATEFESSISQLWSAIILSYKDNILLESKLHDLYLRPSKTFRQELESKGIPQISSLPSVTVDSALPYYKSPGCFELFADRCIEQSDKGSYAITRDLLRSTMLAFQDNPYFACQKLSALQRVPLLANMIFDVIFDEVLRLPTPSKKTIYYSSICVTMVKEFTRDEEFEFGPVVGEALQMIFGSGDGASDGAAQSPW